MCPNYHIAVFTASSLLEDTRASGSERTPKQFWMSTYSLARQTKHPFFSSLSSLNPDTEYLELALLWLVRHTRALGKIPCSTANPQVHNGVKQTAIGMSGS